MPEIMHQCRVPASPGYLTYRFGGGDKFRWNVDTYLQHYITPCVGRNQSFDPRWLVRGPAFVWIKTSGSSNVTVSGEQTTSVDLGSLISHWSATDTHKSVTGQSMWELDYPLRTRRDRTLCVCIIHISGLNSFVEMLWAWKRNFLQFHGLENTTAIASVDWLPLWVSLPGHSTVCDAFGRCSLREKRMRVQWCWPTSRVFSNNSAVNAPLNNYKD
jgi:hypothetical protein